MENNRKELNLVDVFTFIGKGIRNGFFGVVRVCGWCIRMFFQRKAVLLPFLLLGIACGVYSYLFTNSYRCGFVLNTFTKHPYYSIEIVQSMDRYCQNGLDQILALDATTAEQVKAIKPYYVVDMWHNNTIDYIDYKSQYRTDTSLYTWSYNRFYVELYLQIDSLAPVVRQAIIDNLNEEPVLKRSWNSYVASEERWIKMLQDEMNRIDSIQSAILNDNILTPVIRKETMGNASNFIGESKVQALTKEKSDILREMTPHVVRLNDLRLGPISSDLPITYLGKDKSLVVETIKFGLLGLLLGYLFVLLQLHWSRIDSYLKK